MQPSFKNHIISFGNFYFHKILLLEICSFFVSLYKFRLNFFFKYLYRETDPRAYGIRICFLLLRQYYYIYRYIEEWSHVIDSCFGSRRKTTANLVFMQSNTKDVIVKWYAVLEGLDCQMLTSKMAYSWKDWWDLSCYWNFSFPFFSIAGSKWRSMRVALSPAFSGARCRSMAPLMAESANSVQRYLSDRVQKSTLLDVNEVTVSPIILYCMQGNRLEATWPQDTKACLASSEAGIIGYKLKLTHAEKLNVVIVFTDNNVIR